MSDTMTVDEFRTLLKGGVLKSNNPNQKIKNTTKTADNGVVFDSRLERHMYDLLKMHGIGFLFQKKHTVMEPFTYNGETIRAITYTIDFYLPDYDLAIDTKGWATQQGKLRIKMLKRLFADLGRTTTIELPQTHLNCDALVNRLLEKREYNDNSK